MFESAEHIFLQEFILIKLISTVQDKLKTGTLK